MKSERIFLLDFARVIALFCIVWCHSNNVEYTFIIFEKIKWFLGKCGVPIFFTISGYLAFPINKDFKNFLYHKIKRIGIPFIVWLIIYAIIAFIDNNPITSNGDILNIGSAHLWFIYVIFGLFIVAPMIDPFLRTASKIILKFYLVLWIFTGLFPLLIYKTDVTFSEHNWMYTLHAFYGYLGYFILGYYLKRYKNETRLLKMKISLSLGGIFIALVGIYFFIFKCQTVLISDYKGLPIIIYSISVLGLIKKCSHYVEKNVRLVHIIKTLSINSFGIYLCHMIVVMYLYPLIPMWEWMPGLFATGIYVFINIIICYYFIALIKKLPFSHYIIG